MTRQPLAPEIEAAIQELDRIEAQTRNARLDWALQSDEPCDLINDLARACEIARFLMSHTQQAEREELERARELLTSVYYDRFRTAGDHHDAAVVASRRAYRAAVGLPPAPDGSQEGK